MMEKYFPLYVLNYFKYDSYIPAITQMTTEGSQNSLNEIEEFILKYHPIDYPPSIAKSLNNAPKFVFFPGHHISIAKSIYLA